MAMAKKAIRALSWLFPASRNLCAATELADSSVALENAATPEFRPLYRRLSALGGRAGGSVSETMSEWLREGRKVTEVELLNFVRQFRKYKSYKVALELMDWLDTSGMKLTSGSHAIHLDLIAKFKGIDEAEKYLAGLPDFRKNRQTYGALLGAYCQEKMPDKAIALYEKMRELNFTCNTLTYNNLMTLHLKLGQPKMIPLLLQEMKMANVSPDTYTYCLLMSSYASLNDVDSVEGVVREMEENAQVSLNWSIYSCMASHCITAHLFEKAEYALKKLEEVLDKRDRACYHYLISMYASLGNSVEVIRVWKLLKNAFTKTTNRSYLIMFQSCTKLDEMHILKQCYDEWQSNHLSYDIRLSIVVMRAYMRKNMIIEAESVLDNAVEKGFGNRPFTWEMFIGYHLKENDVDFALKSLEFATYCSKPHHWNPNKELVDEFLRCLEEAKDVERAETFCKILKDLNCLNMEVYESLLRTYLAAGKHDPTLRKRIEEDGFSLSSEIENLLESVCLIN